MAQTSNDGDSDVIVVTSTEIARDARRILDRADRERKRILVTHYGRPRAWLVPLKRFPGEMVDGITLTPDGQAVGITIPTASRPTRNVQIDAYVQPLQEDSDDPS
jgi:hypothetical protein